MSVIGQVRAGPEFERHVLAGSRPYGNIDVQILQVTRQCTHKRAIPRAGLQDPMRSRNCPSLSGTKAPLPVQKRGILEFGTTG